MTKDDDRDETVDGPKIAAEILNRLKSGNKERIIKQIQAADPEIAQKIEERLFNFDDLSELTPQGMQVLVQAVDARDLVLSLKTASAEVKKIIFESMTARKRKLVEDDLAALPPTPATMVEQAQRRILVKLDELRTAGMIRTKGKHDAWV